MAGEDDRGACMRCGAERTAGRGGLSRRGFVGAMALGAVLPDCAGSGDGSADVPDRASGSEAPVTDAPVTEAPATGAPSGSPSGPRDLYLGTYTSADGGGRGIARATYDPASGTIKGRGTIGGVGDPSFLAVHPSGHTLYAVNEREAGAVTAVRLGSDEVLGSRSTGGGAPCHLSVHPSGRWLLSANYGSGSVAVHPIEDSGALGERTDLVTHSRPAPGPGQDGPHAHQIITSPDGGHVLAVDLGTDTVYTYRLDERRGTLRPVSRARAAAGSGPRQLTFHPRGRFGYVANEVGNTVTVAAYDPDSGRLELGAPQPTGTRVKPSYPAQFAVTPDGAYAYLANRGDNSVTRYAVEADGARLRLLDTVAVRGDWPRHLTLSPDGKLLLASNQKSGTVSVFHVDGASGRLRLAGEPFASPVAVCALPL
ncbi:lactonase family protein [Streptomyces cavernae]|uniref:lactonase family protein n=1 Tax=Streptomyces cavernae TaxID=2259034 RepID=UPI001EE3D650|nr:lactonase family protein [Streptomyces cavernae]